MLPLIVLPLKTPANNAGGVRGGRGGTHTGTHTGTYTRMLHLPFSDLPLKKGPKQTEHLGFSGPLALPQGVMWVLCAQSDKKEFKNEELPGPLGPGGPKSLRQSPKTSQLLLICFASRAAKQGAFKRGGFPIWTCPSFFFSFLSFLGLS